MMEPRNSSCATYMEIANSKLRIYTLPGWSRCQKIPQNAQNNTNCNALEMLSPYFCASSQHDLLKRDFKWLFTFVLAEDERYLQSNNDDMA